MSAHRKKGQAAWSDPEIFTLPPSDLEAIGAALERDKARLAGARFLITGGTGFFGAWLVESLLWSAPECRIDLLTRNPAGFDARMPHLSGLPQIRLIVGDVREFEPAADAYDYVIHAATESGGAQKAHSRLQMAETIIDGTRRILRVAESTAAKAVLYVSSGAIYGRRAPTDRLEIDEEYPGAPLLSDADIDHDESKRMAEALCRIAADEREIPAKIARCFSFIGPYLPLGSHFAAGNFVRDALDGKEIVVQGDGSAVRTYLYAADLTVWLMRILLDGAPGRAYNVAGGEPIAIAELAQIAASQRRPALPVRILGKPSHAPPSHIVASVNRAQTELALVQTVTTQEGIRRMFDWYGARQ